MMFKIQSFSYDALAGSDGILSYYLATNEFVDFCKHLLPLARLVENRENKIDMSKNIATIIYTIFYRFT